MTHKIYKTTIFCMAFIAISCAKNDLFDDLGKVGKQTPLSYWEIPSSVVKAGNKVEFTAQYYSLNNKSIERTEVWYEIIESVNMEVKYPGSGLNYSKTLNSDQLIRVMQKIKAYSHTKDRWVNDKKTFVLNDSFPTSYTLKEVSWKEVKTFDQTKFNQLFPDTIAAVFKRDLFDQLKESKNLSEFMRFFSKLNVYTTDQFVQFVDSVDNPNTGGKDPVLIKQYMPILQHKFDSIPFSDIIYDNSTQMYNINYVKLYKLNALFKVVETDDLEGVSETKSITLN